jgi:hypothetical protein
VGRVGVVNAQGIDIRHAAGFNLVTGCDFSRLPKLDVS